MVMKREQILARVIIRVRLGMATEEERELLGKWLDEEVANRRLYRNIIRGRSIAGRLRLEDEINQTTDFQKVYEEVARRLAVHRSRRYSLRRIVVVSGAIASCLVGIFVALHPLIKVEVHESISVQGELKEMKVVKEKVMLVLGNGERIGLVKQVPDSLKLEQATLIGTKGGLHYEANTDSVPEREEFHRIETAVGGDFFVVLSDGTRVWLNSQTRLVYPTCFVGSERVIELDGEAYFQVARDTTMPFVVRVGKNAVRVYGTSFNVSAYREDANMITTLETGSVGLWVGEKEYRLVPGDQADVTVATGTVVKYRVNADAYCSWRNGTFIFEEERLESILNRLSRWYNVDIFYQNESIKDLHFTGDLGRYEDFMEVLKLIGLTTNVEFVVNGRNIIVKYK